FKHENGASAEKLMVETFGSGVAWLDYDNDGFLDLFFANGANLSAGKPSPGNALFRNTGKGTFIDVTQSAGIKGNGGFARRPPAWRWAITTTTDFSTSMSRVTARTRFTAITGTGRLRT